MLRSAFRNCSLIPPSRSVVSRYATPAGYSDVSGPVGRTGPQERSRLDDDRHGRDRTAVPLKAAGGRGTVGLPRPRCGLRPRRSALGATAIAGYPSPRRPRGNGRPASVISRYEGPTSASLHQPAVARLASGVLDLSANSTRPTSGCSQAIQTYQSGESGELSGARRTASASGSSPAIPRANSNSHATSSAAARRSVAVV